LLTQGRVIREQTTRGRISTIRPLVVFGRELLKPFDNA